VKKTVHDHARVGWDQSSAYSTILYSLTITMTAALIWLALAKLRDDPRNPPPEGSGDGMRNSMERPA
jgi:hypothetical protein